MNTLVAAAAFTGTRMTACKSGIFTTPPPMPSMPESTPARELSVRPKGMRCGMYATSVPAAPSRKTRRSFRRSGPVSSDPTSRGRSSMTRARATRLTPNTPRSTSGAMATTMSPPITAPKAVLISMTRARRTLVMRSLR